MVDIYGKENWEGSQCNGTCYAQRAKEAFFEGMGDQNEDLLVQRCVSPTGVQLKMELERLNENRSQRP